MTRYLHPEQRPAKGRRRGQRRIWAGQPRSARRVAGRCPATIQPLMPPAPRFLIAESESAGARERRRQSVGRSSGETYRATLHGLHPGAETELVRPAEEGSPTFSAEALGNYDAVFLSGSPLHVYDDAPEVRRQLAFMRAVFASGTPSFGSCAGLQVAVAAAGGTVRKKQGAHEAGFARRITATDAGRSHPLLDGRDTAWDAPAIHSDEVESLPDGAVLLASNPASSVQAAEIRMGPGVFWGVQYHPELPLQEIAGALRRQAGGLVEQGLAREPDDVEAVAGLIEALGEAPDRQDLAWRLGVNAQVTDPALRTLELRNFIRHLVLPTRAERGRG